MNETDYASFARYLKKQGWRRRNTATFSNSNVELVFDTSHYAEVYAIDGTRKAEGRIDCVADLEAFLIKHNLND